MSREPRMDTATVDHFQHQVKLDIQRLRTQLLERPQSPASVDSASQQRTGRLFEVFSTYLGNAGTAN